MLPATPTPLALLAHGAGSSAEFVLRTLGPVLAERGWSAASWCRTPGASPYDDLLALAGQLRPGLVGGVSLGAHAAAAWAAATGYTGRLLLVMPAWTGTPGRVAAASAAAAAEVERDGVTAVVGRVVAAAHPWAAAAVARDWPRYGTEGLTTELRAAATAPAPTLAELGRIRATTHVIGLAGDPLHPVTVAKEWAAAVPGASLHVVPLPPAAAPDLAGAVRAALWAASGTGPTQRRP